MTEPQLTATLLADGPYARDRAPYRLLDVTGPDAGTFLHRLCTQDVLGLSEGQLLPAAFLDAKGKVQCTVRIWQRADGYRLETHEEQAQRLLELLERYHFSEQLAIAAVASDDGHEYVDAAREPVASAVDTEHGCQLRFARRGVLFVRSYGDATRVSASPLSDDLAEALRMAAGMVRVGVETEASTLALEADLDDHCSTRKGCYTGQEIVARIHTYGHVNRKLCLLQLDEGPRIDAPATLLETEDEIPVGRVMHAVPLAGRGLRVGLGYLPKDFQA
ncbi:MAG: folate-binding protein YgfZ, partial [Planctomycetes bacterium]|nr:folate-binding protein YgfZ [Planctomycetota bacterium]